LGSYHRSTLEGCAIRVGIGGPDAIAQYPLLARHPNYLQINHVEQQSSKERYGIFQRLFDDVTWKGTYARSVALYGILVGICATLFMGYSDQKGKSLVGVFSLCLLLFFVFLFSNAA
jgi:hypothetical protein